MSNFPSLKNLTSSSGPQAGALHLATSEVENKFKKKMASVAAMEKEVETMRFAAQIGYPHIDLEKFPVSQQALRQILQAAAAENKVICFYSTQEEARLGALDPRTDAAQAMLAQITEQTGAHAALYTISQRSYDRVMRLYDTLPVVKAITKDISIRAEDLDQVQADVTDFRSLQTLLEKRSTTDIVTFLLGAAFKLDASDLHVEAEQGRIVIRFRLDGILHDAATLPKESFRQLISRIKLVSSLKINITDKPQDGRFTIKLKDTDVDVRVSTMPTVHGESVVMRLLKQSRQGLSLDKIGVIGDAFQKLKIEIERPNGMIITTGPTGSGKTTTLYAVLQLLNKPGVKIITLEDPVEYRLAGINQSQIDHDKDYTFAKGLRSILRQDPDIAMVGEIRDLETADIAIQAALTGHLMLSTIHTNNAAGAIPRFLSMGVKPFLLAPALRCVIGQRLVRRL
ncbi:MAG: type II/IV secretion system protein, partial [Candidatus Magasanikbacteria bacterium]|nr:type II/IV secretion system protein [Candidatus Magasanikbacteria bacterium]